MQQKPCELYAQKHKMIEHDPAYVEQKMKAHKCIPISMIAKNDAR